MSNAITELLKTMEQLRDPERGCPWDRAQTFASIVPHTIEETYEVVDCVERQDYNHLREELGDLLFQVVFLSRIAEEQGLFCFDDVTKEITAKLHRRHPHVFGDAKIDSHDELSRVWESIKQQEREQKEENAPASRYLLDEVEPTHPALTHAGKLQKTAKKVGFDWPDVQGVFAKLDEEVMELREALESADVSVSHIEHEMGDILFACVNLARHVKVNPETALRKANYRFIQRFQRMEDLATQASRKLQDLTLDELEREWQEAKRQLG